MTTPAAPLKSFTLLASLAFLAAACAGCGRIAGPLAPASERVRADGGALRAALATGAPSSLYPLQLGNHWGYERSFTLQVVPDVGPIPPPSVRSVRRDRDLVCVEQRAGRSYVVESTVDAGASATFWVRYRQDGSGLYEADVSVVVPPVCEAAGGRRALSARALADRAGEEAWSAASAALAEAGKRAAYRAAWEGIEARRTALLRAYGAGLGALPHPRGGVETGEITRLRNPLRPGAAWVIRADPLFDSTVEGAETLDLPVGPSPAWRIRIESAFFGPADRVHVWYGRSGLLRLATHFVAEATDSNGNRIGLLIVEENERLVELSLSHGRFAAP